MKKLVSGLVVIAGYLAAAGSAQAAGCMLNNAWWDRCPLPSADSSGAPPQAALKTVPSVRVQKALLCDVGNATWSARPKVAGRARDVSAHQLTITLNLKHVATNSTGGGLGAAAIILVPGVSAGVSGSLSRGTERTNEVTLPATMTVAELRAQCRKPARDQNKSRWLQDYTGQAKAAWANETPFKDVTWAQQFEVTNTAKGGFNLSFLVLSAEASKQYSYAATLPAACVP